MNNSLEAVLFDLDGTLLDTAPDFVYVVNTLLEEYNKPPLPSDTIRSTVSNGARALISLAFEVDEGHADFPLLRERLLALYLEHLAVATTPFPGIIETLLFLAENSIPWGIVTNKPSAYTDPLLRRIDLQIQADVVICPEHVTHPKPHPEPLLLACKKINCRPANSIYVGDHRRDIDAGRLAGMKTVAASYGYIHEDDSADNWNADHCIDSATQLNAILARYI